MSHHIKVNVDKLDNSFLAKARRVTSFNLNTADFQSTDHKTEIQYLYATSILNKNKGTYFKDTIDSNDIDIAQTNDIINAMKKSSNFEAVYRESIGINASAFGPGELMFYLIYDKVTLAGATMSGDIQGLKSPYELKSADYDISRKSYKNINFGTDVKAGFDDVAKDLVSLAKDLNVKNIERTKMNRGALQILEDTETKRFEKEKSTATVIPTFAAGDFLKRLNENRYRIILDKFAKVAKEKYISNHAMVILNNKKGSSDYATIKGIIPSNTSLDKLKKMLSIDVVTSGTMKPFINL